MGYCEIDGAASLEGSDLCCCFWSCLYDGSEGMAKQLLGLSALFPGS